MIDQAAATGRPDRFVGLHFFNPAQVMKLVEVVRCVTTGDEAYDTAVAFAEGLGKLGVQTKDKAGFIVNRLLVPYMLDAMRAYEEGVGSVAEIDDAMKAGAGHPMGPLTLADFVGLDTIGSICDVMYQEFAERRFAQPPTLRKMLSAGWYGKKSGMGFYDYSERRPGPERRHLMTDVREALERALAGGPERHHEKSDEQGKLPVRERVARLLDEGSFVEDALLANWEGDGLGADGVVTGLGTIAGRPVAVMANDPTVKAGSWGPKTVEKIIRIQERALSLRVPMVYLVDSAGARITEQVADVPRPPRRRAASSTPQVQMSGVVPQVCVLFGPSAAGGAYIPAFCDVVIMRDGNASMYLGSPRMAEMVIGEKVTLEEMGGARMHTGVTGVRPRARQDRRGGHRPREALPRATSRRTGRASRRWRRPPRRPPTRRSATSSPPTRTSRSTSRR